MLDNLFQLSKLLLIGLLCLPVYKALKKYDAKKLERLKRELSAPGNTDEE